MTGNHLTSKITRNEDKKRDEISIENKIYAATLMEVLRSRICSKEDDTVTHNPKYFILFLMYYFYPMFRFSPFSCHLPIQISSVIAFVQYCTNINKTIYELATSHGCSYIYVLVIDLKYEVYSIFQDTMTNNLDL